MKINRFPEMQPFISSKDFKNIYSCKSFHRLQSVMHLFLIKGISLLVLGIFFSFVLNAQVAKTINLATAGTLSSALTEAELINITNLTITGDIDARDFKTMRDLMPLLAQLDLSGVNIAAYNGTEGPSLTSKQDYPQNAIPDCAFYKKNSLISILLPLTLTSIEQNSFKRCEGITNLVIPPLVKTIKDYAFQYCISLTTVSIPSSVTSIGVLTFGNNPSLQSITIPSSVTSLGGYAFSGCTGLKSVTVNWRFPLVYDFSFDAFNHVDKTTCILYVPNGTSLNYRTAATPWRSFTNVVEFSVTAVNQLSRDEPLTIYPNPTSGKVKLVLNQVPPIDAYISVVDVTGKTILKQTIQNREESIDLKDNPPGLYLIKTNLKDAKVHKLLLK